MTDQKQKTGGTPAFRTTVEEKLAASGIASVSMGTVRLDDQNHIAILIDDNDTEAARQIARKHSKDQVHFLTSSGRKGGSFRLEDPRYSAISMAVLPVRIAQEILKQSKSDGGANARMRTQLALYVKTYFGSVARLIGLPPERCKEYEVSMSDLGADAPPIGDRALQDAYLASLGWQPPVDMLERLGLTDPWIVEELLPNLTQFRDVTPGLAVFFCRQHAMDLGFLETISSAIEETGYKILSSRPVEGAIAKKLSDSTRGGYWGAGLFSVSGGPPAHLIFAVDVFPIKPPQSLLGQHPFLDNEASLSAKTFARDKVLSSLPSSQHFNPLHSSDNSAEAFHLAEMVLPKQEFETLSEEFLAYREKAEALIGEGELLWRDTPVAASFWMIEGGETRLRKVFRPQYAGYLDQVAQLHDALSADWPEIPKVLARGEEYLDLEVSDRNLKPLGSSSGLPGLATILRLRKVLDAVQTAGFTPVGWSPERDISISWDRNESLMLNFDQLETTTAEQELKTVRRKTYTVHLPKSDPAQWTKHLGVQKSLLLGGKPTTIATYRKIASPTLRGTLRSIETGRKLYRKARSHARSLLGRSPGRR